MIEEETAKWINQMIEFGKKIYEEMKQKRFIKWKELITLTKKYSSDFDGIFLSLYQ